MSMSLSLSLWRAYEYVYVYQCTLRMHLSLSLCQWVYSTQPISLPTRKIQLYRQGFLASHQKYESSPRV